MIQSWRDPLRQKSKYLLVTALEIKIGDRGECIQWNFYKSTIIFKKLDSSLFQSKGIKITPTNFMHSYELHVEDPDEFLELFLTIKKLLTHIVTPDKLSNRLNRNIKPEGMKSGYKMFLRFRFNKILFQD
jgi:hypothetical protein